MVDDRQARVVVASVLEADAAASVRAAESAPAGAWIEIRGDLLPANELGAVVGRLARPAIATVRRTEDGGRFSGSELERRGMLESALDAGARFIDVEWGGALGDLACGPRASRVILSAHGMACRGERLRAVLDAMLSTGAARLKIVPHAANLAEAAAIRDLLDAAPAGRLAAFATGRAGVATRILAPRWGSWATYGSLGPGRETAEGQVDVCDLLDVYDVLGVTRDTRFLALVGGDVGRSPSPAMHSAAAQRAGLDLRYVALDAADLEDFARLISPAGALPVDGFGVTRPFKERAARLCATLGEVARGSGAVNTVLVRDGVWHGENTDAPAALAALAAHTEIAGSRVAVLGGGGTARAIAWSLRRAGAEVELYTRDPRQGQPLEGIADARWDVLINATPLGMSGESALARPVVWGRVVLDAAYGPQATPLVEQARNRGLATIDGVELLARQGALQFSLLTGVSVEAGVFETAARVWLARAAR